MVDLTGWIDVSKENGVCDAISLIDNLFSTELCQTTQLSESLGTLQGLCPALCGLCDENDDVVNTRLSNILLYRTQMALFQSGVLRIILFTPSSSLTCGSSTRGTVSSDGTVAYSFNRNGDGTVDFSLCSDDTDFDTILILYDIDGELVGYNDDFCNLQSRISYTGSDVYLSINVEGYGGAGGNFNLSISCEDTVSTTTPRAWESWECNSTVLVTAPPLFAILHAPSATVIFSICEGAELNTQMCVAEDSYSEDYCTDEPLITYSGQAGAVFMRATSYGDPFTVATTCLGPGGRFSAQDGDFQYGCGIVSGDGSTTTLVENSTGLTCGSSTRGTVSSDGTVAYSFDRTANGTVVFSLCSSDTDFDTILILYDTDGELVGYNDDFCNLQSQISYTGSDVYLSINIGGYGGASGDFALTITCNHSDDELA